MKKQFVGWLARNVTFIALIMVMSTVLAVTQTEDQQFYFAQGQVVIFLAWAVVTMAQLLIAAMTRLVRAVRQIIQERQQAQERGLVA